MFSGLIAPCPILLHLPTFKQIQERKECKRHEIQILRKQIVTLVGKYLDIHPHLDIPDKLYGLQLLGVKNALIFYATDVNPWGLWSEGEEFVSQPRVMKLIKRLRKLMREIK